MVLQIVEKKLLRVVAISFFPNIVCPQDVKFLIVQLLAVILQVISFKICHALFCITFAFI